MFAAVAGLGFASRPRGLDAAFAVGLDAALDFVAAFGGDLVAFRVSLAIAEVVEKIWKECKCQLIIRNSFEMRACAKKSG